MDSRAREVLRIGNSMFAQKAEVDTLWQEIALNFYPERADFTEKRNHGDEYSDHLFSSYPVLARRELANLMSANMRPQSDQWASIHVTNEDLDDGDEERRFLEHLTDIQWRAMYDPSANFVRATKQTDHDYASFGNGVIMGMPNTDLDGLLFRNYHLRDNAWSESANGVVDHNNRDWNPTARQLKAFFPETISSEVRKACEKDPEKKFKCRHVVMPSRLYHYKSPKGREFPFASLYVECETETVLEEVGLNYFPYVIPRWQVVSGSVFGRSMATDIALPDARTTQVVTRTLREAGEKYVDPPMITIADATRGDISLYAGGITVADMEYDERLGEVLRPVSQNSGAMPIGFEIAAALREDIRNAFFLDKIQLPEVGKDMTAYEVRKRLEEHIRAASPLFEPIEQDYNAPLCQLAFNIMAEHGGFPLDQMPDSLQGADIKFTFHSPLQDAADQNEAAIFTDVMSTVIMPIAEIDPSQLENVNMTEATRAAMKAKGWKADWFNPEEAVAERRQQMQQQAEMQQAMAVAGEAGAVAEQGGKAGQAVNEAMAEQ